MCSSVERPLDAEDVPLDMRIFRCSQSYYFESGDASCDVSVQWMIRVSRPFTSVKVLLPLHTFMCWPDDRGDEFEDDVQSDTRGQTSTHEFDPATFPHLNSKQALLLHPQRPR